MSEEPVSQRSNAVGSDVEVNVAGVSFFADVTGALWWPETRTLIVADLHLEKGSSYARRGSFLPPYDSRATLKRLQDALGRYDAERVILLGDSFHDLDAMHRLPDTERQSLEAMQSQFQWLWVTGNHDPSISERLGGQVCDELQENGLVFRHEPGPTGTRGELAGHFHPVARIVKHGRSIRRRCFIADQERMIVPAFGAYTGGLNVCDPAIAQVFGIETETRVWMLGESGVYRVAVRELRGD